MTDTFPKPLAVGYISAQALAAASELTTLKRDITEFAIACGFILLATFVEDSETTPAAFDDMVQNTWRNGVRTIIMPSVIHLACLGNPVVMKAHLEHHLGGKVLFTNSAA
ncbi:hypothetical protein OG474_17895 [Kribbella sp. NBC_01505]|uniref:hypothetical protein n=1 Tax=Kribbella sp. NBC_01505 TaxID=2903580 RepID=UPI0038662A41